MQQCGRIYVENHRLSLDRGRGSCAAAHLQLFPIQIGASYPNFRYHLINLSATVGTSKAMIQSKKDIPPEEQRLRFRGDDMDDEETLESYNVGVQVCYSC